MQTQEQQLIENLFSRLKQAEGQSGPRDAAAEQLIKQHLQEQPGAPYYMSQAILIQEAALKKLNERISQLESQVTQLQQQQQPQQSSGGFLSGLFGGGSRQQSQPAQQQSAWGNPAPQQQQYNAPQQQYNAPQQQYGAAPAPAPARGTGFLGGALQTAVGVAGGVVMADMLTSMFHHSQPEEIVNIINEPALPEVDTSLDTFNGGDRNFLDQDNGWGNSFTDNTDFGNDSFDTDYDDDSFV